ncbi:MAG: Dps family protein [Opitutales bacterium]
MSNDCIAITRNTPTLPVMEKTKTVSKKKSSVAKKAGKTGSYNHSIVNALRQVVADSYALLGQTHICHWNVRGHSFFALHDAFEKQYTELFTAIDEIAERIRALGAFAPGGLGNLAKMANVTEIRENAPSTEMVEHLAASNRALVADLEVARDLAGEAHDDETEDLMIARIQVHEKTIWMLESYLSE